MLAPDRIAWRERGQTIVALYAIDASRLALRLPRLFSNIDFSAAHRAQTMFIRDFETGLAEKPDHIVAKFAHRVLTQREHQQMVHQGAAEHVGQRFEIFLASKPADCTRSTTATLSGRSSCGW